ncbi:MAG: hypothetical protein RL757_2617 [Bacteroidota bacterium]|jgi:arginine deiminase
MININVNSEIGILKKVVLCYANPYKISNILGGAFLNAKK